jgi:DNA polymerase
LACENVTQACANDLLRHALRQLDNTVLHIHDEIVVECPARQADAMVERVRRAMCDAPVWAEGIPLDVEINVMTRYGK